MKKTTQDMKEEVYNVKVELNKDMESLKKIKKESNRNPRDKIP
jgi:hypothetical protein